MKFPVPTRLVGRLVSPALVIGLLVVRAVEATPGQNGQSNQPQQSANQNTNLPEIKVLDYYELFELDRRGELYGTSVDDLLLGPRNGSDQRNRQQNGWQGGQQQDQTGQNQNQQQQSTGPQRCSFTKGKRTFTKLFLLHKIGFINRALLKKQEKEFRDCLQQRFSYYARAGEAPNRTSSRGRGRARIC